MKMKPIKAMLLLIWGTATCAMELTQDDLQREFLCAVYDNDVKTAAFWLAAGAQLNDSPVPYLDGQPDGQTAIDLLANRGGAKLHELLSRTRPDLALPEPAILPEPSTRSWSIRGFLASQIEGAKELLAFGKSAAQDLAAHATNHHYAYDPTETFTLDAPPELDNRTARLVYAFLHKPEEYQQLETVFPPDIKKLLARHILHNHPIIAFLIAQASSHVCIATKKGTITDNARSYHDDTMIVYCNDWMTLRKNTVFEEPAIWQANNLHRPRIQSAQFNRTGTQIVTASRDRTSKILCVKTGTCLKTLEGHTGHLKTAQFNSAGSEVVTASSDKTAKTWCTQSGLCNQTFTGHTQPVNSAQYNPCDDSRIVTASDDCTARIWDAVDGSCLHILEGHAKPVRFAQFNQTGNLIATASFDETTKIWNAETGTLYYTLPCGMPACKALFTPDSNKIVVEVNFDDKPMTFKRSCQVLDVGRLFALSHWLENCKLEEALLFHSISVTHRFQKILSKRSSWASLLESGPRFDFNRCPHLHEILNSMPAEFQIQDILSPYVIRCVNEDSYDSESDDEQ